MKHFALSTTWVWLHTGVRGCLSAGALLLCATMLAASAPAQQNAERRIALITNQENPLTEISESELRRIYEKKETKIADGIKVVPFNQSEHNDIYGKFSKEIFGKSPETMRSYWIGEKISRNATPPTAKASSQTLLKYVRRIEGAIAYVYEDEVDDTVKIITVTGAKGFVEAPASSENSSTKMSASNDSLQETSL